MHSYMLWRRKVEDHYKHHRLKLLRKLLILANFKILDSRDIHLHGIIRDWGKQIQRSDWIEVWPIKIG